MVAFIKCFFFNISSCELKCFYVLYILMQILPMLKIDESVANNLSHFLVLEILVVILVLS